MRSKAAARASPTKHAGETEFLRGTLNPHGVGVEFLHIRPAIVNQRWARLRVLLEYRLMSSSVGMLGIHGANSILIASLSKRALL
jgi:hypothetical protein